LKSQTKKSSTDPNNDIKISDTDDLPPTPNNFKRNIFIAFTILIFLAALVAASVLLLRSKRS
jgi:hypothetical protein